MVLGPISSLDAGNDSRVLRLRGGGIQAEPSSPGIPVLLLQPLSEEERFGSCGESLRPTHSVPVGAR